VNYTRRIVAGDGPSGIAILLGSKEDCFGIYQNLLITHCTMVFPHCTDRSQPYIGITNCTIDDYAFSGTISYAIAPLEQQNTTSCRYDLTPKSCVEQGWSVALSYSGSKWDCFNDYQAMNFTGCDLTVACTSDSPSISATAVRSSAACSVYLRNLSYRKLSLEPNNTFAHQHPFVAEQPNDGQPSWWRKFARFFFG